jgi:hypothetical protein
MKRNWFLVLFSAVCLEGLGRRYLPQIPSVVFYYLKDVVLLIGLLYFRPSQVVRSTSARLYRGFGIVWVVGVLWTVLEMVNPEHQSVLLAFIGLRAYWLWWLAPPVIAEVLRNARDRRRAITVLLVTAIGVSVLAAFQFASPADSSLNMYSVVGGEEIYAAQWGTVGATGRARVASTFSFISGFTNFTIIVPTLLLSVGLEAQDRTLRRNALLATVVTSAVVPMSGSRGSIVIGIAVLVMTMWTAGLFLTRIGRRVLLGGIAAAVVSLIAFPDAMLGVQSRFENQEETQGRFMEMANVLPPVALATVDYPTLGIGTGMQQNARLQLGILTKWDAESEVARLLVELGPVGYSLIWIAKLGLIVALLRAHSLLKQARKLGAAGAALSFAALTMVGNMVFDHVWQALYFTGCGFILAEVVSIAKPASINEVGKVPNTKVLGPALPDSPATTAR